MVKQVEDGERQGKIRWICNLKPLRSHPSFAPLPIGQANDLQVSTIRISSSGDLEETSEQWKEPWLFGVYTQLCGDYFINHHKDPY